MERTSMGDRIGIAAIVLLMAAFALSAMGALSGVAKADDPAGTRDDDVREVVAAEDDDDDDDSDTGGANGTQTNTGNGESNTTRGTGPSNTNTRDTNTGTRTL